MHFSPAFALSKRDWKQKVVFPVPAPPETRTMLPRSMPLLETSLSKASTLMGRTSNSLLSASFSGQISVRVCLTAKGAASVFLFSFEFFLNKDIKKTLWHQLLFFALFNFFSAAESSAESLPSLFL